MSKILKTYLKASPIVGVLGQRQTGKTTLCEAFAAEIASLDQEDQLDSCEASPENFIIDRKRPFLIDECQLSPRLFPALKSYVHQHKEIGQFLLTGSVRFTSRKAIHESMTGRILNTELLPLGFTENHNLPLKWRLNEIFQKRKVSHLGSKLPQGLKMDSWIDYLETGGLPGICFSRNSTLRAARYKSHIDTLLSRDLKLVSETSLSKISILSLLRSLALRQGTSLDWTHLKNDSGISTITLKKLVSAFEALFIVRPIRLYGKATLGTIYFEDQGMASFLTGFTPPSTTRADFVRFLFANLREQFHYKLDSDYEIMCDHTRGGAQVPLVFQSGASEWAILPQLEATPTRSSTASAESFLKRSKNSIAIVVMANGEAKRIHDRLFSVPWASLLF